MSEDMTPEPAPPIAEDMTPEPAPPIAEDMTPEPAPPTTSTVLLAKLKTQAPTAAVSAVVALIAVLALGGNTDTADVPELPDLPTISNPDKPAVAPRGGRDGLTTRLVSCGDSTRASLVGDDTAGVIVPGPGADGSCTLLFSAPWSGTATCAVNGGKISRVSLVELSIVNINGATVSFRCGGQ